MSSEIYDKFALDQLIDANKGVIGYPMDHYGHVRALGGYAVDHNGHVRTLGMDRNISHLGISVNVLGDSIADRVHTVTGV